jgi:hypothetical protein
MSQITPEEMQKRGALLKKAKQILIQEYAAIRTQQHQQWIVDSESSWRTNGVLMAYPPGKLYPSEQDIIDKALELYNKSIAATVLKVDAPVVSTPVIQNTQPEPSIAEPLGSSPMDVTAKLEEVYKKGSINPGLVEHLLSTPVDKYVETLMQPVTVPEPIVEPAKEEPIVEPAKEEPIITDTTPKHSLLRSVLSGWLSKNKDKEA